MRSGAGTALSHVIFVMLAWPAIVLADTPCGTRFLGTWRITGSVAAPWNEPVAAQDTREARRLAGRRLTFTSRAILGPRPLGCSRPSYKIKEYAADMLFQGTLTDAKRQAAVLGFTLLPVRTLETGCEGLIDFHFVDARTAKFALSNRIFTIRRGS